MQNFLETGYIGFGELIGRPKIIHHRSYHGEISGSEAAQLLSLAPEKGYITRYSSNKKKYVLSVYCPSLSTIQHFLIAVDEDAPSYVLQGHSISFQSIDGLLDHYECNPVSQKLGGIGISYSRMNTRQFKFDHEKNRRRKAQEELVKAKQELEKAKKELERAQNMLKEQEKSELEDEKVEQPPVDPLESMESESNTVPDHEEELHSKDQIIHIEEIESLKKERDRLKQELEKSARKQDSKCKMQ